MPGAACAALEKLTAPTTTVARNPVSLGLVSREAVEKAVAAGADQVVLTASTATVHGVPGSIGPTQAVMMTYHGVTCIIARPVVTGRNRAGPGNQIAP